MWSSKVIARAKTALSFFAGFLAVIFIWSLAAGDLQTRRLEPQAVLEGTDGSIDTFIYLHSLEKPPGEERWASFPGWASMKNAFIFGDSFSDTWFDPHGDQPSGPANPFGNANRTFHGPEPPPPKWTTFLLQQPSDHDGMSAFNLAVSGAPINGTGPAWAMDDILSVHDQVHKTFIPRYGQSASSPVAWSAQDSMFIIWAGTNDLVPSFGAGMRPKIDESIRIYSSILDDLYNSGARHFLLLNVPPFEVTKPSSSLLPEVTRRADIAEFNAQLRLIRNGFMQLHSDATAHLFDTRALWTSIMAAPNSTLITQEISVTDTWCYQYSMEPLGHYFWTDDVHVGVAIHQATAAYVAMDCFGQHVPVGYCH